MNEKLNLLAQAYAAARDNAQATMAEVTTAKKALDEELAFVNKDARDNACNEWLLQADPWDAFFKDGVYLKEMVSFKKVGDATVPAFTTGVDRVSIPAFVAQGNKRKIRLAQKASWIAQAESLCKELCLLLNNDFTTEKGGSVGKARDALQGLMDALYKADGVIARRQDVRYLRAMCSKYARQLGRYYTPSIETVLALVVDVFHVQLTGQDYAPLKK